MRGCFQPHGGGNKCIGGIIGDTEEASERSGQVFGVTAAGSSIKVEIMAGLTTFFAMAYIIFVNPNILNQFYVITGDTAMASAVASSVFVATCLSAFIGTLLMAVYAKVPFAQASGMGLNAFFAYTVMLGNGYSYNQALAIVFISGVLFILITLLGLREAISSRHPQECSYCYQRRYRHVHHADRSAERGHRH